MSLPTLPITTAQFLDLHQFDIDWLDEEIDVEDMQAGWSPLKLPERAMLS